MKSNSRKRILAVLLPAMMILFANPVVAFADTPDTTPPISLYAAQNTLIGGVNVTDNGTNLTVTYKIFEPGWYLTETHTYIGADPPK